MEYFELIKRRHSIRTYQDKPVSEAFLSQILEAANRAPSAGNLQAYEIFVVEAESHRAELAQAADQEFLLQAPIVLVFCVNPARSEARYRQRGVSRYALQDATIACTFAMLAAADLGLGSVWVGAYNDQAVMAVLGNPPGLHAVAMLPIGYPAGEPRIRDRRSLDDLVHRGL